jgi:hypothetical protein
VSKYCLQHSPVPVIVVRPSSKRDKKKAKRRADPGRRVYQEILSQSPGLMLHDNGSVSGITEGLSNASISTLGEPNSLGGGAEGVSPKATAVEPAGSPSPGTLTPAPESPVCTRENSGVDLDVSTGTAESRRTSVESADKPPV